MAVVVVVVSLAAAWLLFRAVQIKDHLESSADLIPLVQDQIASDDSPDRDKLIEELQAHTSKARSAAADPVWRAAGLLPWVGYNFSAITDITVAADVTVGATAPLMDFIGSPGLDAFAPKDGKIELQPIQDLSPQLTRAAMSVNAAYESVAQIDPDQLLPQLSQPVGRATSAFEVARDALGGAASTAEVLPAMLGANDERSYLVLVQNNAEIRATGGIPGALVVLKASGGKLELSDQGSASDLGRFDPPFEVDEEQERIYTTRLGGYMQNVNLTPDFPTAASTAKAMWEKGTPSSDIDGVIALDAVVLSQLLTATGPVELTSLSSLPIDTGKLPMTLRSENVVETLLSDVYREIEDPVAQDAYFAAVANDIFGAVTDGSANPMKTLQAVEQSLKDQRLFLWSAHEEEQKVITASPLGGSVAAQDPTIGVYFNDGTGAKMDYYVEREVQLIERCQPDGYYRYAVQAKLTNNAPANAAEALPDYVTGGGNFGVDPGTVRSNVYAYGPAEWLLESASVDGEASSFGSYRHGASPVAGLTVSLKPGESTTVEFEFSTLYEPDEPRLRVTPTVQPRSEVVLPGQDGPACAS